MMEEFNFKFVLNLLSEDFTGGKSYIRKTKPDYQLEIFPDSNDEYNWCGYFLNFGDLFVCAINALEAPDALYEVMQESYINAEIYNENCIHLIHEAKSSSEGKIINDELFVELNRKYHSALDDFIFNSAIYNLIQADKMTEGLLGAELQMLLSVDKLEYGAVTADRLSQNFQKYNAFSEIDVHIRYYKDNQYDDHFTTEEYTFKDWHSLVAFDIRNFIRLNKEIKVCENCGKFFIPGARSDEKYCDFIYRDGKSCKAVAFEERLKNDDVLKAYRKIYKTQNARKQRYIKNIPSSSERITERFGTWSVSAQSVLKLCQDGEISIDEMTSILSKSDWMKGGATNA